jgi:hypothetical protein
VFERVGLLLVLLHLPPRNADGYTSLTPSDSTGQLCTVEHLYGIQNSTGTVNANNLFSLVPQVITGGLPVLGAPQSMTCDNCTKEAYNIVISNVPQVITSGANSSISGQCGASFIGSPTFYLSLALVVDKFSTDGNTPAGVSQTAADTSLAKTKGSNGALRSLALWDELMILFGFGTLFAVLL